MGIFQTLLSLFNPPGGWCHCGHEETTHQHFRKGTDCALCDCTKYRPAP